MSEGAAGQPGGKLPFEEALLEVVKTLHKDPVLAYGLGAGIVLVGALALTTSLAPVLVVAAVFVVVLLGRIMGRTQAKRGGGIFASAFLVGGHHEDLEGGSVEARTAPTGDVRAGFFGLFTSTKGAKLGSVKYGGSDEQKDG